MDSSQLINLSEAGSHRHEVQTVGCLSAVIMTTNFRGTGLHKYNATERAEGKGDRGAESVAGVANVQFSILDFYSHYSHKFLLVCLIVACIKDNVNSNMIDLIL